MAFIQLTEKPPESSLRKIYINTDHIISVVSSHNEKWTDVVLTGEDIIHVKESILEIEKLINLKSEL